MRPHDEAMIDALASETALTGFIGGLIGSLFGVLVAFLLLVLFISFI